MVKEEFNDRLKKALKLRNMKAADLVAKTKIPKSAVSYYLAGKSTPKADRLYLICKTLDVSEAWILGYDVEMEKALAENKKPIVQGDGLSENMRKLIDFAQSVPEDKAAMVLQVMKTIVEAD